MHKLRTEKAPLMHKWRVEKAPLMYKDMQVVNRKGSIGAQGNASDEQKRLPSQGNASDEQERLLLMHTEM